MSTVDIAAIDLPSYNTPMLSVEGYISLSNALEDAKPAAAPPQVNEASARMSATVVEADAALVTRLDEDSIVGLERAFDGFADRIWVVCRNRLSAWEIYAHDGLELFNDKDKATLELDARREQARIAGDLRERMFGSDGTDFLRLPYPMQATHMRARLALVESKGLSEVFATLVGPELVALLYACQTRYEAMVSARASREGGSKVDLRALRHRLQRMITRYTAAVITMLDEEVPESGEIVQKALRPLLIMRTRRTKASASEVLAAEVEEDEDDEVFEDEVEVAPELAGEDEDEGEASEGEASEGEADPD